MDTPETLEQLLDFLAIDDSPLDVVLEAIEAEPLLFLELPVEWKNTIYQRAQPLRPINKTRLVSFLVSLVNDAQYIDKISKQNFGGKIKYIHIWIIVINILIRFEVIKNWKNI